MDTVINTQTSPLWFPYTQMKTMATPTKVLSANGVYLETEQGPLIDAISSWWCMIHGYNHPQLNSVIHDQVSKMAHVMIGGLTHQPAEELARSLVEISPDPLVHVFFSDSGSVGCEVALKMAIQYWYNSGLADKTRFVGLKFGYHGDTTGVMAIGDPEESMHHVFSGILPKHYFVSPPDTLNGVDGISIDQAVSELDSVFRAHHQSIAGFICEPLLQGAGGLRFHSPQYLDRVRKLCDQYQIILVFDEVATGFGRTGTLFAANQTQVCPDIMVLGKGLSGGYLGLSATLTTDTIFNSFLSDDPNKAFMHGPTFMGNPLACRVALESIDIFRRESYLDKIGGIRDILEQELGDFRAEGIAHTRVLGAVGVIQAKDARDLDGVSEFAIEHGVWLRPFRDVAYTMPPYIISEEELIKITTVMKQWFLEGRTS